MIFWRSRQLLYINSTIKRYIITARASFCLCNIQINIQMTSYKKISAHIFYLGKTIKIDKKIPKSNTMAQSLDSNAWKQFVRDNRPLQESKH